jgi:hypothetical protein
VPNAGAVASSTVSGEAFLETDRGNRSGVEFEPVPVEQGSVRRVGEAAVHQLFIDWATTTASNTVIMNGAAALWWPRQSSRFAPPKRL